MDEHVLSSMHTRWIGDRLCVSLVRVAVESCHERGRGIMVKAATPLHLNLTSALLATVDDAQRILAKIQTQNSSETVSVRKTRSSSASSVDDTVSVANSLSFEDEVSYFVS